MRPCAGVSTLVASRERDQFVSLLSGLRSLDAPQVDHWRAHLTHCLLRRMDALPPGLLRTPRFDHIAISSAFGNPRELRTWSGAPANVASGLERLGVVVKELQPHLGKTARLAIALRDMLAGRGRPVSSEQILRSLTTRRALAAQVAEQAGRGRATNVLHTGTLDLLPNRSDGLQHYLYCDHTWALARRHHIHATQYTEQ